jgi:hypothetical protein
LEQFFTSLSRRQTMLLLTSLAFGGTSSLAAYAHLSPEEGELLRHRAEALLQIPKEKRIPLLIREIKRLAMMRRRALASAEPARLAELLQKERPALVEVMLRALPVEVAESVRAKLGKRPPVTLRREVRPRVLALLRWKLEQRLSRNAPRIGVFRFSDVMLLQERDLLAVCDRMGARVLATALAGLPDEARHGFLGRLPPDQRSLASRAAEAGASRKLAESDAKMVVDLHGALENPSLGMRSAGAQRLARAAIAQSPEFAQKLADKLRGDLGTLMKRWVKDELRRPLRSDGRKDIVEQLERLSHKGIIDRPVRILPPMPMKAALPAPAMAAAGFGREALVRPPQPRTGHHRGSPSDDSGPITGSSARLERRASTADSPRTKAPARGSPSARTEEKSPQRGTNSESHGARRSVGAGAARGKKILRDGELLNREALVRQPKPRPPKRPEGDRSRESDEGRRKDERAPVRRHPGRGPRGSSE